MNEKYLKNSNIEYQETENQVLIFDTKKNEVYLLDEVGKFLWDRIEQHTLQEIIELAQQNYEGDNIESDIQEFVGEMVEKNFISLVTN